MNEIQVSYLLYADNVIFVGQWSKNNVENLTFILKSFYEVLGLQINFHKSIFWG